ncbi:hypothetical protein Aple_064870 [Acrocarpospora pleiomorpha]|uniref:Uncharacterized protein n=1 Tax=Acrocarpospora pleiomorpha TaxID=90975 RepID=A0A5M3XYZ6_9ACTN|nr:hypothetical protein [Acrocarpospora pleiomorpha]GES23588.1 hypothetical protein Aple_064870 [Acrocarpospora pleiomorpha]
MTAELVGDHAPETADGPLGRVRTALRVHHLLSFYRAEDEARSGHVGDELADDGRRLVVLHPAGGSPATIGWVGAVDTYLLNVPYENGEHAVMAKTEQKTVGALACLWGVEAAPEQSPADRLRALEQLLAKRGVSARIVEGEQEIRLEVDGTETAVVPVKVVVGGRGGAYLVYIGSGQGTRTLMAREPGGAAVFVMRGLNRGV